MPPGPSIVVHPDKELLAHAAAARLVTAVTDAVTVRGDADIVLTGGSMGAAILRSLTACPAVRSVDWSRVTTWWGDERFLPAGDPERNETQAREAGLTKLPLSPDRVRPMAASDGPDGQDVAAAASRYAGELASRAASGSLLPPPFDVVMLGVGPDAHVASLFPGRPELKEQGRTVVPVHGSPKPPPTRISLTFPALCNAQEVWFLVAGEDKAESVARVLGGAAVEQAPAAGVTGIRATRWLLDQAAASQWSENHT